MPLVHISSVDDPRLDDYRNVPDPELIRSKGLFVAEGRLVVRRLLEKSNFPAKSILLTNSAVTELGDLVTHAAMLMSPPVFVVDQTVMNAVTGFNFHRGCLAIGIRQPTQAWPQMVETARLVVVLEQVANADNMGGIFRNAAAFGVDAALLESSCVDPLYRKAIRTSMGAALQLPFAAMPHWADNLAQLRERGFLLVALTPSEQAKPLSECVAEWRGRRRLFGGGERRTRVALLLGHEGGGLSDAAMQAAQVHARIPMPGDTDSLNVATAAAIALYEIRRGQREP